jgi:hypothetical protein
MDASGRLRWLTQYDNDAGRIHPVVDRGGNVYLVGEFYDLTLGNTNLATRGWVDLFVQKLNTLGPPLNIMRDSGQTWLTWSALAAGFSVQESTNASDAWRARAGTPIRVGADFRLAVPPTPEPRYFRLTK